VANNVLLFGGIAFVLLGLFVWFLVQFGGPDQNHGKND